MILLWPTVALAGFVLLAAVVVALGTSSTSRYEFERNRVQAQRQRAAVAVAAAETPDTVEMLVPAGPPAVPAAADSEAERRDQALAMGVAAHPAGKRLVDPAAPSAWWLVDEQLPRPGGEVVAGPFDDRVEADWAALTAGRSGSLQSVYGVRRPDGGLARRQSPQERAWLAELSEQLDRLPEDWDGPLSDEDALVTLVVEVAAALVEAGLTLHDCAGNGPAGGVCLTPEPAHGGVLVSWHQHERMSREQVRGAAVDAAVQRTMNAAVADCLTRMGFAVEPFGATGCALVLDVG